MAQGFLPSQAKAFHHHRFAADPDNFILLPGRNDNQEPGPYPPERSAHDRTDLPHVRRSLLCLASRKCIVGGRNVHRLTAAPGVGSSNPSGLGRRVRGLLLRTHPVRLSWCVQL